MNQNISGSYKISSGTFDPWISVAPPGAGDLFAAFRDNTKNKKISNFDLNITSDNLLVSLDTGAKFIASWDGSLSCRFIDSPFPALGAYAATARFTDENTLEFIIHWLNGWFETTIYFALTPDGMEITTKKLRLNVEDNYLVFNATAIRQT